MQAAQDRQRGPLSAILVTLLLVGGAPLIARLKGHATPEFHTVLEIIATQMELIIGILALAS